MMDFTTQPLLSSKDKGDTSGVITLAALQHMADTADQRTDNEPQKPRKALTAYNLFFQAERQRLLQEQGASDLINEGSSSSNSKAKNGSTKLGFAGLARYIASKWKAMDNTERMPYEALAARDKQRYKVEKMEWKRAMNLQHGEMDEESEGHQSISAGVVGSSGALASVTTLDGFGVATASSSLDASAAQHLAMMMHGSFGSGTQSLSSCSVQEEEAGRLGRDAQKRPAGELMASHAQGLHGATPLVQQLEPLSIFAASQQPNQGMGGGFPFPQQSQALSQTRDNMQPLQQPQQQVDDLLSPNAVFAASQQQRQQSMSTIAGSMATIPTLYSTLGDDCVDLIVDCLVPR